MPLNARNLRLERGGAEVLRGIDLSLRGGERVGLVGPNGAGKSSLMLTLAGAIAPTGGDLMLDDRPITPGAFSARIGLVFQQADDQLFCPTVADDVAFGARNLGLSGADLDQAVARALDRCGIAALAARPVHHLSGGEKRLACLAGILVMRPEILLLDEPSAALDLRNRRQLIELLRGMDQAMLIATHDLELVLELCPRVVVIDDGRIVADGPARDILGDGALMAAHGQEVPHSLTPHPGADHHRHGASDPANK